MKKFSVLVKVSLERAVMVDAESALEAGELAADMVAREHETGVGAVFSRDEQTIQACDDVRTETYVCHHCQRSSLKASWGPGRVRCPSCKRLAPSPAEARAEALGLIRNIVSW